MEKLVCLLLSLLLPTLLAETSYSQQSVEQPELLTAEVTGRERLEFLVEILQHARKRPVEGIQAHGVEALQLLEAYPDPLVEIGVRLDLSWCTSRAGDMETGLEQARLALELASELRDAREHGICPNCFERVMETELRN